jgi:hypothetical protein
LFLGRTRTKDQINALKNHQKGVTPKMRERQLRFGVNLQETLKQKGVKKGLCVKT